MRQAVNAEGIEYEVALSFAGEDREYVRRVASALYGQGIRVFFDEEEEVALWGKNLVEELERIYTRASYVVVMFISESYAEKSWTRHERRSALTRAIEERREYVLPVRFDTTELPGLSPSVSFLPLAGRAPEKLANQIAQKLVHLGGTVPTALGPPSSWLRMGARRQPLDLTVSAENTQGEPLGSAQVTIVSPNGTSRSAVTDELGRATLRLPGHQQVQIFIAHPSHDALLVRDHDSAEDLKVTLVSRDGVSSIIFNSSTGYIPGLGGRLNPIEDQSNYYAYIDNTAVNEKPARPAHFQLGQPLAVEHEDGTRMIVTFLAIVGDASLLRYEVAHP